MMLILRCFSHQTAHLLWKCMKKNEKKQRKNRIRNFKKKKTPTFIYHTQLLRLILENNASLRSPTTRMLAPIFHKFCRILN